MLKTSWEGHQTGLRRTMYNLSKHFLTKDNEKKFGETIETGKPKKVGSGNHFQFSVFNGVRNITGIAWNMSENMPSSSTPLDLAFKLRCNHWNGRKTPQMVLEDWKLSA